MIKRAQVTDSAARAQRNGHEGSSQHPVTEQVEIALATYMDSKDAAELARACQLARDNPVDVDALLVFIRDYGASTVTTAPATRRLRFALGLPVVPGPVCRPSSPSR